MEIKTLRKYLFLLIGVWIFLILGLGVWWLYLILNLSEQLGQLYLQAGHIPQGTNFIRMVKWEGPFFFVLLMSVSLGLISIYLQDLKRSKSIQSFFASLTHELKTPLASIRLQSEVLSDVLPADSSPMVNKLVGRLVDDVQKLENEVDKILQLSRLEQGGNLNPIAVDLVKFLKSHLKAYANSEKFRFTLEVKGEDFNIWADEFALILIFRNLIDNTFKHAWKNQEKPLPILLTLSKENDHKILLRYEDHGPPFLGNLKKLGNLFYKFQSSKGSGIGLYLAKRLMEKMGGNLVFQADPSLVFLLTFSKAPEDIDGPTEEKGGNENGNPS